MAFLNNPQSPGRVSAVPHRWHPSSTSVWVIKKRPAHTRGRKPCGCRGGENPRMRADQRSHPTTWGAPEQKAARPQSLPMGDWNDGGCIASKPWLGSNWTGCCVRAPCNSSRKMGLDRDVMYKRSLCTSHQMSCRTFVPS